MRKKLKPIKDRYILPPKKVLNFSNYKSYTDHVNIVPAYQKLDLLDRISPHDKFEILLKQRTSALNEDSEDDSLLVGPSLVEE